MWIASKLGFFSVVIDNQRAGRMLVRARCKADIFNLFDANEDLKSMEPPTSDESRDYRWRLSLDKTDWLRLACRLAQGIDYGNFKSEVAKHPEQGSKLHAYHQVWHELWQVQRDEPEPLPAKRMARKRKAKHVPKN
jgi:hypothetical protein